MSRSALVAFHASGAQRPRKRILFITNMWPEPGKPHYGPFVRSQAESLESKDVAVDVLTIRGHISSTAYLLAGPASARAARRRSYDVIHIHTGHAAFTTIAVLPRPIVISYVGGDLLGHPGADGELSRKSAAEAIVFRQVSRLASATITKSEEMSRALPASRRARNHVLPNGVDLTRFAPMGREVARMQLGWSESSPVALFVGDPDDPRKNHALAAAAVQRAATYVPELRLHVAWGVEPEQVIRLMSAADCLVFTSRSEGSPNVVKEAMAATLPIVSTDVGDVRERLNGLQSCHVVRPDEASFAEAIIRVLSAPGRAVDARLRVAEVGSETIADRLIAIYDSLER